MKSGSSDDARQRFGLLAALLLSVLLHVVIALLSVWFPFTRSVAVVPSPAAEETITFHFARDVEPTTEDPLQDSPFFPEEPRADAAPVPPARPDLAEVPPLEERPLEPEPEAAPEPPAEREEAPAEVEAVDREDSQQIERPDGDRRQSPAERAPAARRVDLKEALRDFERAIARRPAAPAPQQPATAAQPHVIVPDLSRIPFSGFGVGNLAFESKDFDWSDYGRQIYMAIWRAWHNRLWLTTDEFEAWAHRNRSWRLDHMSQVRFVIERNGQVSGIVLEAGSGCEPLDASALEALAEVILPPLPEEFPRQSETVHARFLARGLIHQMRSALGALKARGYF